MNYYSNYLGAHNRVIAFQYNDFKLHPTTSGLRPTGGGTTRRIEAGAHHLRHGGIPWRKRHDMGRGPGLFLFLKLPLLLGIASGRVVSTPWIEFRDDCGQLVQRTHLPVEVASYTRGQGAISEIQNMPRDRASSTRSAAV